MLRNIILAALVLAIAFVGWKIFSVYRDLEGVSDVPAHHIYGTADADLTVVEFFDYNCGYCRQAHATIKEAIARDGNILYVPRAVAYLGEESAQGATLLYAAAEQGKLWEMHDALMTQNIPLSAPAIRALAELVGVNPDKLDDDRFSEQVRNHVLSNMDTFEAIGGKATPTFVIGESIFYVPEGRMPTADDFIAMFAQARANR